MAFTPHTQQDVAEMLKSLGVQTIEDLFNDVPASLLLKDALPIPALTEYAAEREFEKAAAENRVPATGRSFLGAGVYRHFIPAAVRPLISRGEFMTCYTPYQAEVSQGTLQVIFEFQSHICALTGLDVANASMYDGATSLSEAITLAARETGRNVAWLPELLHPNYRAVCETALREIGIEVRTLPLRDGATDFSTIGNEECGAVVIQTPNVLGIIEDGRAARAAADRAKALLVACVNPTSLAILAPPGEYGADIACGEAQALGIPLSFGGPYAGFFAGSRNHMRKMPGRIVGQTHDKAGNEGFVLTLQTREQHIRREKATSNICTNQGLFALMATMYLTFLGKEGLIEVAETCLARTQSLVAKLEASTDIRRLHAAPHFHEVALRLPIPAKRFLAAMREEAGILAGFALEKWYPNWPDPDRLLLVNCTELNLDEDIDRYVQTAKLVL